MELIRRSASFYASDGTRVWSEEIKELAEAVALGEKFLTSDDLHKEATKEIYIYETYSEGSRIYLRLRRRYRLHEGHFLRASTTTGKVKWKT